MMNKQEIINALTKDQIRTDLPELKVGNNVKVYQKIIEGSRKRTQMFEGTIIKKQGGCEVQCHFCRKRYAFTAQELEELLEQAGNQEDEE